MRTAILIALPFLLPAQDNWPSFRGPGALGVSDGSVPARWNVDTGENIAWKTAIPGLGHSSPVIWGDRIFLTTAISSNPNMVFEAVLKGQRDERHDKSKQEFRVLALDKRNGRIVWNQLASSHEPRIVRHPHNSYASPTPATDGKYLVVFFGSEGLFCYDVSGKLLWRKDLGTLDQGAFDVPDYQWGSAASPILWKGKVYLQVDMHQGSFLAAFDATSGKELWRTTRDSKPSWSTPAIVESAQGAELVANGVEHVCGYDPETGRELWRVKGTSMISVPTPFVANDLIYVFSGYSRNIRRSYAIRPGASGDITGSEEWIAWMREEAPYLSTPIVVGKHLYTLSSRGVLNAYNALTGESLFQQRLGSGAGASASLVAAGNQVYAANEDGEFHVFRAGPKYEELALNRMLEPVMATPAISGNTLFIRGSAHLFAVRQEARKREVAITIDDLPRGGDGKTDADTTLRMTAKLLKPFQRGRIPVTGFVNECPWPDRLYEVLSMWKSAGAELGNHTCSHPDLNSTSIADYTANIAAGEKITTAVIGRRPRYFRHPFLRTGKDAATKKAVYDYLQTRGYRVAPVTLDNSDYMFARVYASALEHSDNAKAKRVLTAYLQYMDSIFDFFERRSVEVLGYECRQILLIHANQLNADSMPELLALMKRRGYSVVTLERALQDKAYEAPEEYAGPGGFSWIHRWSKTKGMAGKGEPEEPEWIRNALRHN